MFRSIKLQCGLSLIELMIAITLGLIIVTAVGSLFVNSSRSNAELQKSAQQIENGRYATEILTEDLKHAGFYGQYFSAQALSGTQNPCEESSTTALFNAMALPVQAFRAPDFSTRPDLSATTCGTLLPNANLVPGADVIVVRRADTTALAIGNVAVSGELYIQANSSEAEIQIGNGAAITDTQTAGGAAATILNKALKAAPIRKYHVHVYFVAPCSQGTGAGGLCAVSDDTIPTLKRLELRADGGPAAMAIVPLVEGIQYVKAEWGIDDQPATVNASTGVIGDGTVDAFRAAPSDVEFSNAIAAKLFILARNTESSTDYVDDKTYTLGTVAGTTTAAANDAFKRHVFSTEVQMMNMGGRKEIPE